MLAQIAYPLTPDRDLGALSVVTVLLFAAATLASAGVKKALPLLVISAGIGFGAEVVGVHTGWPFGSYHYTHTLGAMLAGVPLVVPLAWTMMAWPALVAGRRTGHPVLGGAVSLVGWDLFLDPQMVHDGHWVWTQGGPHLDGIPLTNALGWAVVSLVLMAVLDRALPAGGDDRVPLALWLWTWASSVLANAVFFGRPGVALAGGVGMALVGIPLIRALR